MDLTLELVPGRALERHVPPLQVRLVGLGTRPQVRRFEVRHVGEHEHALGVLGKTAGERVERQPGVLHRELLADDEARNRRRVVVEMTEHVRQDDAVAGAGIEDPNRWRSRLQVWQLLADLRADHGLLARGRHEHQVLLTVVEEAESIWWRTVYPVDPLLLWYVT